MTHADFLEFVLADEVTRREAKTASMLERATENTPPPPRPPAAATARFARDPAEYRATQLTLLPGGKEDTR